MKATKIKMIAECTDSNSTQEIDSIYLDIAESYWKKETVYDYLIAYPDSIRVNLYPYPFLKPIKNVYGEKYVRSAPSDIPIDNLLLLPRE